jgi:acetyl esterase/lipase
VSPIDCRGGGRTDAAVGRSAISKRALHWVKTHVQRFGGDPGKVFVSGESAGGHLTALLATCGRDYHPPEVPAEADLSIAGAVPLYGVFDFSDEDGLQAVLHPSLIDGMDGGMRPFLERIVMQKPYAKHKLEFDLASPTFRVRQYVKQDLDPKLPPMMVVHGTHDQLAAFDDAAVFFQELSRLREKYGTWKAGETDVFVSVTGGHHAFGYITSPRACALADSMYEFVAHHSKRGGAPGMM